MALSMLEQTLPLHHLKISRLKVMGAVLLTSGCVKQIYCQCYKILF